MDLGRGVVAARLLDLDKFMPDAGQDIDSDAIRADESPSTDDRLSALYPKLRHAMLDADDELSALVAKIAQRLANGPTAALAMRLCCRRPRAPRA